MRMYDRLKNERGKLYNFGEYELDELGYELLRPKRMDEAIAVFLKNVEVFPDSGNAHDSLGEGYLARGDKANALASYKRAVELDPKNENAKRIIAELEK